MAVFALRMASRRCFLTAIAVLALAILLVAMTAAGGPAQAVADALLIDTDTNVAFGNISGEDSRTMDVWTTPEGTIWFRVRPAVQFAWGFLNPESAKTLLSKMLSEDPSALYGHWTMLTPGSSPERVGTRMLTGVM